MREEIIGILQETFYLRSGEIDGATPLREFISDSMDAVELIAVLSSTYSIHVEPAEFDSIQTVADVIDYVERSTAHPRLAPLESF